MHTLAFIMLHKHLLGYRNLTLLKAFETVYASAISLYFVNIDVLRREVLFWVGQDTKQRFFRLIAFFREIATYIDRLTSMPLL